MCIYFIKHERPRFSSFPNSEKRVENITLSRVLLASVEMPGNVVKRSDLSV